MFKDEEIDSERISDFQRTLMDSSAAFCLSLFEEKKT